MNILIADDQERTRNSLRALLEASLAGPSIREAASGEEAVRLAAAQDDGGTPFDLILMDIRMPGLDGIEATRAIKKIRPGIRIIALSMYPAFREEAGRAGADAFVSKGDPPEQLLSAIVGFRPTGGREEA